MSDRPLTARQVPRATLPFILMAVITGCGTLSLGEFAAVTEPRGLRVAKYR